MCTSPILIRNKKTKHSPVKRYMTIPCGECFECQQARNNQIYIRLRAEYEECVTSGGVGFMCCLTYSNDLVPTISINGKTYLCFNKKDVINFIKRLRIILYRFYMKEFHCPPPPFKYFVAAEFGELNGRPHYHLLFFFPRPISDSLFNLAFREAMVHRYKKGNIIKRYFGKIVQCERIDPKRGGIHYSAKYVCKDVSYKVQNDYIKGLISTIKHHINVKYDIIEQPKNDYDELHNRCIRSRKDYKKEVAERLLPYRHMLQFYMLSNDMGVTALLNRYKSLIDSFGCISMDGFKYSVPPIVFSRYERYYGFNALMQAKKKSFENYFECVLQTLKNFHYVDYNTCSVLRAFVRAFVQPFQGRLIISLPSDIDCLDKRVTGLRNWQDVYNEFEYIEDDFYFYFQRVQHLLDAFNNEEVQLHRFSVSKMKFEKQEEEYKKRKRNKGF